VQQNFFLPLSFPSLVHFFCSGKLLLSAPMVTCFHALDCRATHCMLGVACISSCTDLVKSWSIIPASALHQVRGLRDGGGSLLLAALSLFFPLRESIHTSSVCPFALLIQVSCYHAGGIVLWQFSLDFTHDTRWISPNRGGKLMRHSGDVWQITSVSRCVTRLRAHREWELLPSAVPIID